MKKICKKLLSLVTVLALCVCLMPAGSARAAGDAMSLSEVKKLLNAEELHPQRTGYEAIDRILEQILAPCKGKDTYTKIKTMYDWSVNNVEYSWAGYSQTWAPAYDKFTLKYNLAYETGLPEAYPKDMIYRAYHMLTAKTGVCYDWGILFAVMSRYVGIESYVHTGILQIGDWRGHHGWTELRLGGKNYIFDAQQDNRSKGLSGGRITYEHFGIAPSSAWRYSPETAVNAARDRELLPVDAERIRTAQVVVKASRSGQVEGSGSYPWESEVTLTAAGENTPVLWYTPAGKLLGEGPELTFLLGGNTTILALFPGDCFVDLPAGAWYTEDVCAAAEQGLFQGVTPATFEPSGGMTRGMVVSLLARMDGGDISEASPSPFTDVDPSAWYAEAVNWAYENGVVQGVSKTRFQPKATVTREQATAMIIRYLETRGVAAQEEAPDFADADRISPYARDSVETARSLGILTGYSDGTVRPKETISRAQGAAMAVRALRSLAA